MQTQNKIKADIILSCFIFFSFFAIAAIMLNFAINEGTLGNSLTLNFIADKIIYFFPFVFICAYLKLSNPYILVFSAVFNILIYSFIIIRLFGKRLQTNNNYGPYNLTVYTTFFILIILLIYVISLFIFNT